MNKKHGAWSKNEKIFLGLLAPILVLFFCFNTLPLIKGFYYGLTNFRGFCRTAELCRNFPGFPCGSLISVYI